MNKQTLHRIGILLCVLLCMAFAFPAMAQSTESTSDAEAKLLLLLNGEPVEQAVLNLSVSPTLQFTANKPVTWKSGSTRYGTISQTGLLTCLSPRTIFISATAADGEKVVCEVRMVRLVTGITLSGNTLMTAGGYTDLSAQVTPSNAANKNIKWTSSDTSVATVNSRGRVTAKDITEAKTVTITASATDGSGITAEHTITVKPPVQSISITSNGEKVQTVYVDINDPTVDLDALILPAAARQDVVWSSSRTNYATVDANGVVTVKRTGSVTITATTQDRTKKKASVTIVAVCPVQSITVSGSTSVTGGKTISLSADVAPSNATEKAVKWASSDTSVATVDSRGRVTAKKLSTVQTVVITASATDGSGVVGTHTITVTPAIQSMKITRSGESISNLTVDIDDTSVDLSALITPADACQDVKWTSSNTRRVVMDQDGHLNAKGTGSVTVTATAKDGSDKKTSITVNIVRSVKSITISGSTSVTGGKMISLSAGVAPSNATEKAVKWTSSDTSVATVDSRGRVTAKKLSTVQTVVITASATDGSGVVGTHTITVTPAIQSMKITRSGESISNLTVDIDDTSVDLSALITPADACQDVKWTSSNTRRVVMDQDGHLNAKGTGSVTVTATAKDGSNKTATVKVNVIREVKSITVSGNTTIAGGTSGKLTAAVLPSNATNTDVTWSSSNAELLTVNKYGYIEAAKVTAPQQVTVTATAKDGSGVTGSIVINITPRASKVNILESGKIVSSAGIDLGGTKTVQLAAQIAPAAAAQDVKWSSSNTKYATVNQNGLVTGLRTGTVTITATAKDGSNVKGSITVTIGILVKKLTITGAKEVTGGNSIQLSTTALPSNATNKTVIWSSSNESLATVSSKGVVTTSAVSAPSQVTITATAKDGSGTFAQYTLSIVPPAQSISISRLDAATGNVLILLAQTGTAQLSTSVYPSTASQNVTWKSSDRSVVTVDSNGRVNAKYSGTAKLTATATDGSGVKAEIWVGVSTVLRPYYLEVDRANCVVRVYERGEDNSYSKLIKRMICSIGRAGLPVPKAGMYEMHGGKMVWMDRVAMYATRIQDAFLFHSVTYTKGAMDRLDADAYGLLGTRASAGCIRLLTGDAKWIYDNVEKKTFMRYVTGVRDINEYGAVTKPALVSGNWDPTNPDPSNPDFDPTYSSDVE